MFLLVLHTIIRKEVKSQFGSNIDTLYNELDKIHDSSEDAKHSAQRAERKADLFETTVVSLSYLGRASFVHIPLPLTRQRTINARMGESEKYFHSSIEEVKQAAKIRHSKLDAYGWLSLNLPNLCAKYLPVEAAVEKTLIAIEENTIAPQLESHSKQINELQNRLDAASHAPTLVEEARVEGSSESSIEVVAFIEKEDTQSVSCMAGFYLPRRRRERLVTAFTRFDKNPASKIATIQAQARGMLQRIIYRKIHLQSSKKYILLQAHCRGALARRRSTRALTQVHEQQPVIPAPSLVPNKSLQRRCIRSSSFRLAPQSEQISELRSRVDAISRAVLIIEKAQKVIK